MPGRPDAADTAVPTATDMGVCRFTSADLTALYRLPRAWSCATMPPGIECLRGTAFCAAALIADEIDLRALEQRLVARQIAVGLGEGGFIRPRIDLREQIALLTSSPSLKTICCR